MGLGEWSLTWRGMDELRDLAAIDGDGERALAKFVLREVERMAETARALPAVSSDTVTAAGDAADAAREALGLLRLRRSGVVEVDDVVLLEHVAKAAACSEVVAARLSQFGERE